MKLTQGIAVLAMAAALQACGPDELVLEGERLAPREVLTGAEHADGAVQAALPINLPAQQSNAEWTHRGGTPSHALFNAAIGAGTTRVWTADIGQGSGRKHRITADPIVGGGRVYTLDSRARLTATATNGATAWAVDLTPAGENPDSASGGGIAYAGGQVFATTGFGELVALDAASGAVIWRQRFDAAVGGAPTVSDGLVYAVARDGSAWAVRASDGKVQWQVPGMPSASGVSGVSAPAVDARIVVFPFASGDLLGALKKGGLTLWQSRAAGARLGRAYATVVDLTGDPVIVGDTVYAGSSAGRLVALSASSGQVIWRATEGANSPVQVAGGSVFLVSDEARLIRLDAATGQVIWAVDMPYFTKDKPKRQQAIHANFGPVLAGNRLFVASSDGLLRVFDPASGAAVGQAEIPGGAASAPVVAGGTLYVVGANGQLHAFR